jgi:hypothetical protein
LSRYGDGRNLSGYGDGGGCGDRFGYADGGGCGHKMII